MDASEDKAKMRTRASTTISRALPPLIMRTYSSSGSPRSTAGVGSLSNSSQRIVFPLSPQLPSKSLESPTIPSPTPATAGISEEDVSKGPEVSIKTIGRDAEGSSSAALLDFVSRIARFEPRIRRYALAKSSTALEPITAFFPTLHSSSNNSGIVSPKATEVNGASTEVNGASTEASGASTSLGVGGFGFSLVDLESILLRSTAWWKGKSLDQNDGEGLDVDLSEVLDNYRRDSSDEKEEAVERFDDGVPRGVASEIKAQDKGPGMFLNYYTSSDLIALLTSTGVLSSLVPLGYKFPSLIFDTSDPFQHRLSLIDASLYAQTPPLSSSERFLIDLYMKRRKEWTLDSIVSYQLMKRLLKAGSWENLREMTGEIRAPFIGLAGARDIVIFFEQNVEKCSKNAKKGAGVWDVTEIAWLQMHDPLATTTRPLLPGQRFPGLGLGRQVASVMEQMAEKSHVTDGLLNFPFHFYQSIAYSARGYKHIDPVYEAYTKWMQSQLGPFLAEHGFCFVAWGVSMGFCRRITEVSIASEGRDEGSEVEKGKEEWKIVSSRLERYSPQEQIYSTSPSMASFMNSKEYVRLYEKYLKILMKDGGANLEGVDMVSAAEHLGSTSVENAAPGGGRKRSRLIIDIENCPELWKYSENPLYRTRNPETGEL